MFRIIRNRNAHGSDGSHRARLTPSELQKNCEKLAAEKFNRETANDEIDSTTEGITMLV